MDDVRLRCFLSSSKRNLFEEINAISSPEKKADKSKVNRMKVKLSKIQVVKKFNCLLTAKILYFRKLQITCTENTNNKIIPVADDFFIKVKFSSFFVQNPAFSLSGFLCLKHRKITKYFSKLSLVN